MGYDYYQKGGMFSRLGVFRSAVITIAGSIVLCSMNDRKERGGRGERGVRVVASFELSGL
jgi:hypothetical protein